MKIRAANSVEAPALAAIIVARHKDSRYGGRCEVDEPLARKIMAHAIHRSDGTHDGATFVRVAEDEGGKIIGFVMGQLGRIYMVGDSRMNIAGLNDRTVPILAQAIVDAGI